jgi:hypothetical protein
MSQLLNRGEASAKGELESQPARPLSAWGARVTWGLDAGVPLLVAAHLWIIVLAVQGRARFAALAGAHGEYLQFTASLTALWLLSRWLLRVYAGPAGRTLRAVEPWVVLSWLAHAVGFGAGARPFAGPDYDGWCAALSTTWHAIPWLALVHLASLALLAADLKQTLLRLVPLGRFAARGNLWLARVAWSVAVGIAFVGVLGVFALATGSAAIF